jgi:hypothetical protein
VWGALSDRSGTALVVLVFETPTNCNEKVDEASKERADWSEGGRDSCSNWTEFSEFVWTSRTWHPSWTKT